MTGELIYSLHHPDDDPAEPPYDFPYSNRCGNCGKRAVKKIEGGYVCQNCGNDYRPTDCEKCGLLGYARGWDKKGGCPACQGFIPKPIRRPPPSEGEQMFWRRSEGEY